MDFAKLSAKLRPATLSALSAFRQRHSAVVKQLNDLKQQRATLDLAQYSQIKNQKVVQG
jgi:hypothetical protein